MQPVFRFAPSPNGDLHLGHAYSALVSAAQAERHDGVFLVRIEDIDPVRSSRRFEQRILDDLAWLGLAWQQPVRRQSEHFDDYAAALDKLIELGVVYKSFATRGEIKAMAPARANPRLDPDGQILYPQALKRRDLEHAQPRGRPHAWRLDAGAAAAAIAQKSTIPLEFTELCQGPQGEQGVIAVDFSLWGDVVIARKDVPTSYHLSVVFDDAAQNISHVTRGHDLFHATHIHRILQVLLDLPTPLYYHHDLIRDDTGRRLSKSAADKSLRALREEGAAPADIRAMVGFK